MARKRALTDAAADRLVQKQPAEPARSVRRRSNRVAIKILLSIVLGFVGGFGAARWIKIF